MTEFKGAMTVTVFPASGGRRDTEVQIAVRAEGEASGTTHSVTIRELAIDYLVKIGRVPEGTTGS